MRTSSNTVTEINVSKLTVWHYCSVTGSALLTEETKEMNMEKNITLCPTALAIGIDARNSAHCARSQYLSRHPLAIEEAEAKPAKAKPTPVKPKAAKPVKADPKAPKPVKAPKAKAPASRLILKGNAPIRALLKDAAVSFGGTRLQPVGFDSYSAFLNGVPLKDGAAEVSLVPVKGNEPIKGCNVKLIVKDGVPTVTTTGKPAA